MPVYTALKNNTILQQFFPVLRYEIFPTPNCWRPYFKSPYKLIYSYENWLKQMPKSVPIEILI